MNKFLTLIVVLFGIQFALAADPTPPPPSPPPPVGLSIEGDILLLLFSILIIGYYFSIKYTSIKKGSL